MEPAFMIRLFSLILLLPFAVMAQFPPPLLRTELTTNPVPRHVQIQGSSAASALTINTNQLVVTNGNVGIGTNMPAAPLHVVGRGQFWSGSSVVQIENGNTLNFSDEVTLVNSGGTLSATGTGWLFGGWLNFANPTTNQALSVKSNVISKGWMQQVGPQTNNGPIVMSAATASRAAIYNGDKELTNSVTTATQIGYLQDTTNNIGADLLNRLPHLKHRRWGVATFREGSAVVQLLGESGNATGTASITGPDATDGVMENFASTASGDAEAGFHGSASWRTGRELHMSTLVKVIDAGSMIAWVALSDAATTAAFVDSDNPSGNYAGFRMSTVAGDTTWKAITKDNATQTITDTGIATNSQARCFEIIDRGSDYLFRIDGSPVATNSANLPASGTNMRYIIGTETQEAVAKNIRVGWVLTTSQK